MPEKRRQINYTLRLESEDELEAIHRHARGLGLATNEFICRAIEMAREAYPLTDEQLKAAESAENLGAKFMAGSKRKRTRRGRPRRPRPSPGDDKGPPAEMLPRAQRINVVELLRRVRETPFSELTPDERAIARKIGVGPQGREPREGAPEFLKKILDLPLSELTEEERRLAVRLGIKSEAAGGGHEGAQAGHNQVIAVITKVLAWAEEMGARNRDDLSEHEKELLDYVERGVRKGMQRGRLSLPSQTVARGLVERIYEGATEGGSMAQANVPPELLRWLVDAALADGEVAH